MCGICGIWNAEERPMVETMVERMHHRGPDEEGFYDCANGTLGHARLSIMDPTGGHQPIFNEDKSLAVIANGEIYNYPKLRKKLASKHSFKTNNDSEVLLHLFEEEGPEMVKQLDGMFAFCITNGKSIFLARDPIGIKPLYWGRKKRERYYSHLNKNKCRRGLPPLRISSWLYLFHNKRDGTLFYPGFKTSRTASH